MLFKTVNYNELITTVQCAVYHHPGQSCAVQNACLLPDADVFSDLKVDLVSTKYKYSRKLQ